MVVEKSLDASHLCARKPSVTLQSDRVNPELRQLVIMLDMHIARLFTISGVKKETVGTDSQNGWYYLGFIAFFPVKRSSSASSESRYIRIEPPNGPLEGRGAFCRVPLEAADTHPGLLCCAWQREEGGSATIPSTRRNPGGISPHGTITSIAAAIYLRRRGTSVFSLTVVPTRPQQSADDARGLFTPQRSLSRG